LGIASFLRAAADGALAVLIAPVCAACATPLGAPTRGAVCDACWSSIVPLTPPFCATCGDSLPTWRTLSLETALCARCRRAPPLVSLARAIGPYEGALRAIIQAFKYQSRPTLARHLAERMTQAGSEVLSGADIVVPVPLHRSRERARGFNQAGELARHLGVPSVDALRRTRRTPPQAELPAARRHLNVRGAFAYVPAAPIDGLAVVLVDDVNTTGATLNACAASLRMAGAREVRALTAARAVARQPR
jgi:ComF family protein